MMINSIEEYLNDLRAELKGCDPATIQDALSDAEGHLFLAMENARSADPAIEAAEALAPIIAEYGSPQETAAAYREIESRIIPGLAGPRRASSKGAIASFFSIFSDPKAWGALLYMLISLLTGTVYFSWAVISASISISFALFIFGLPLAAFSLLSYRGLGLLEGRIVEALLGTRMPRRPLFTNHELSWQERLKAFFYDKTTWSLLAYFLLMLPLGVIYFSLTVILIALSLSLLISPIAQVILDTPMIMLNSGVFFIPTVLMPLFFLAGIVLFALTMHLAKVIGNSHGRLAKSMLISE